MVTRKSHRWQFKARFRRRTFGWRSQPAVKRVKEAVSEIKRVARSDPTLGAEGAIAFLERVSPALEQVDSSSGAIGSAVNHAIAEFVTIIANAPVAADTREDWLERLWDAYQEDDIPYIELLGDHWGRLCASKELASRWADRLIDTLKLAWSPDPKLRGFFKGATNCLSALLTAERYDELLRLLKKAPYSMWHYRQYGVRALAALGRQAEAIRYAEAGRSINDPPIAIARACEEILLSSGLAEDAYRRYAITANQASTYLAWFRAVAKKYPGKAPAEILGDLVAATPGSEGRWFAAAKHARLFDVALDLAAQAPCDPKTLTRAARDYADKQPAFAVGAGLLALHWLIEGYGYEITGSDVWAAYLHTMKAAQKQGTVDATQERIRALVAAEGAGARFVKKILGGEPGL